MSPRAPLPPAQSPESNRTTAPSGDDDPVGACIIGPNRQYQEAISDPIFASSLPVQGRDHRSGREIHLVIAVFSGMETTVTGHGTPQLCEPTRIALPTCNARSELTQRIVTRAPALRLRVASARGVSRRALPLRIPPLASNPDLWTCAAND